VLVGEAQHPHLADHLAVFAVEIDCIWSFEDPGSFQSSTRTKNS
jgi:hypothetical protein